MRVKVFYNSEQREGTVGAVAVSSDDELRNHAKGDPLRSTKGTRQPCVGRRCRLGLEQLVRSHAWLQGSKRGANEADNVNLKPASTSLPS